MARPDYRTLGLTVPVTDAIDPKLWRELYAFGITLGPGSRTRTLSERMSAAKCRVKTKQCGDSDQDTLDDLVTELPDAVIRWHLRAALSELELKLGVNMGIQVVRSKPLDENSGQADKVIGRLPYTHGEAQAWYRIDLPHNNIISVERVRGFYYSQKVWEISGDHMNEDLIRLEWSRPGTIHILPTNLQSIAVTQGGNYGVWETIHLHRSPIPDFWAIDYTTGPIARTGEVGKIEAALANWVYCAAGIMLMSIGGMGASKGITSTSTGIDGLSRSVSLQASAMYGINSALETRMKEANERINWKQLRVAKRGIRVKMFSF